MKLLKKLSVIFAVVLIFSTSAFSNSLGSSLALKEAQKYLSGNIGFYSEDDKNFIKLSFQPDFRFGRLSMGLDLSVYYNLTDKKFRNEKWNSFEYWVEKILYMQWSTKQAVKYGKKDSLFFRVGNLTSSSLGQGFIFRNYNNQVTNPELKRKVGLDVLFMDPSRVYGFEGIFDNLGKLRLFGTRLFTMPLKNNDKVPSFFKNLEIGGTFAKDNDKDALTEEIQIMGADIGLPILTKPDFNLNAFVTLAKIKNYGSGFGVGAKAKFSLLHFLVQYSKNDDDFVPGFFGPMYEINKGNLLDTLKNNKDSMSGWYSELSFDIANAFSFIAGYENFDDSDRKSIHGELKTSESLSDKFSARMVYDKTFEGSLFSKAVLESDENTYMLTEVSYPITSMIQAVLKITRTFEPNETGGYKAINTKNFEAKMKF